MRKENQHAARSSDDALGDQVVEVAGSHALGNEILQRTLGGFEPTTGIEEMLKIDQKSANMMSAKAIQPKNGCNRN